MATLTQSGLVGSSGAIEQEEPTMIVAFAPGAQSPNGGLHDEPPA